VNDLHAASCELQCFEPCVPPTPLRGRPLLCPRFTGPQQRPSARGFTAPRAPLQRALAADSALLLIESRARVACPRLHPLAPTATGSAARANGEPLGALRGLPQAASPATQNRYARAQQHQARHANSTNFHGKGMHSIVQSSILMVMCHHTTSGTRSSTALAVDKTCHFVVSSSQKYLPHIALTKQLGPHSISTPLHSTLVELAP
jgi:hypothetical protein